MIKRNAAEVFLAGNRAIYTGTDWKLELIRRQIDRFVDSWGEEMSLPLIQLLIDQVAVPAIEPNELIDQCSLIVGKARNQVDSLVDALAFPDRERRGKLVVPDWLREMYVEGGVFSFITSDVGVREKIGIGPWRTRRNFYLRQPERSSDLEQLEFELLQYYATDELYGKGNNADIGKPAIRAIESSLSLTMVKWKPLCRRDRQLGAINNPVSVQIYPACSVVGLDMRQHPLADPLERPDFIKYVERWGVERGLSRLESLRDIHGRAGGLKTEILYEYAMTRGIPTEILADATDSQTKLQTLIDHAQGSRYDLLRGLFLTMLNPGFSSKKFFSEDPKGFLLEIYPSGAKDLLTV